MDIPNILSLSLVLFCIHLSNCAPVFNGLLKTTNASNEHEPDFQRGVFIIPANVSTHNISENDSRNSLIHNDLSPSVLHGKSTFKKIVGKVKSWKNKITGGGGSNKIKNNKDGSKGVGGISVRRPTRPTNTSDNSTLNYIMIGFMGVLFVFGMIVGCLKGSAEEEEEENTKEEKERKKDCEGTEESLDKKENKEKECEGESEILKKRNSNEDLSIIESTAL